MPTFWDIIFFLYFLVHIPITVLFDSQMVLAKEWYPDEVLSLSKQYCTTFKDTLFPNPPIWYKTFVYSELFVQFPFILVAAYAFLRGQRQCPWIRIPAIIYASHVCTTLAPIMATVMLGDFSKEKPAGPSTLQERLQLCAVYSPFLLVPLLLLYRMACCCPGAAAQPQKAKRH